jgi:CBS domain-containing protein
MPDENLTARALMRVSFLRLGSQHTLREALGILLDPQARREDPKVLIILNGDGSFAGLLSPKDLLRAALPDSAHGPEPSARPTGDQNLLVLLRDKLSCPVSQAMNREVPVASPDDRLPRLIERMYPQRLECIPVVEKGRILGLVHLTDVFNEAARLALASHTEPAPETAANEGQPPDETANGSRSRFFKASGK